MSNMGLKESWLAQSTPVKTLTIAGPFLGAVLGVVTGWTPAVDAWDGMGLPTMATRAYVRHITMPVVVSQKIIDQRAIDLQIDMANDKLERTGDAQAFWNNEKRKADSSGADQVTRFGIDKQLRELDNRDAALREQLRALKAQRP